MSEKRSRKITPREALALIEEITAHESLERLSRDMMKGDDVVELIYRIAHSARAECQNAHEDWRAESWNLAAAYVVIERGKARRKRAEALAKAIEASNG